MSEPLPSLTKEQAALVRNSSVVPRLAQRFSRTTSSLTEDDLLSIGHVDECHAAIRYDSTRNVPFEAFSYPIVHAGLRRAVSIARKQQRREQTGMFDEAHEYLQSVADEGTLFETPAQSRQQVDRIAYGILGAMLARAVSEASIAPSEAELAEHSDRAHKLALVRTALDKMGERGEVLKLRYFEHLDWEETRKRLNTSLRTAHTRHGEAVEALGRVIRRRA